MPKVGPAPKFTPPPVVRRKLSNGLEVLIAERHELPIVSLDLVVKGGETLVPAGKEGLAALTAVAPDRGDDHARRRSSWPASSPRSAPRSTPSGGPGVEQRSSLTTLTKHTAKALELYTDVLLHPSFPEKELERLRAQRLAA